MRVHACAGLQFLAQAKVMQSDASRILITAYVESDTIPEAINCGEIYRFVSKPFVRKEFLTAVNTVVLLAELRAGMIVARGIANLRGVLLLHEGQVLAEVWINKLHVHNRITPIAPSLFVYARRFGHTVPGHLPTKNHSRRRLFAPMNPCRPMRNRRRGSHETH
jgi:hypothetical protein